MLRDLQICTLKEDIYELGKQTTHYEQRVKVHSWTVNTQLALIPEKFNSYSENIFFLKKQLIEISKSNEPENSSVSIN